MQYWSTEQVRQFLGHVRGHRLFALFWLAIATRMRRGEVLGLRWKDVDLEARQIHVRQTLIYDDNRDLVFAPPKTKRSRRSIRISPEDVTVLRRHRAQQAEERLACEDEYNAGGLVFCTSSGTRLAPRNLVRQYKRLVASSGLPEIRFHYLRHTRATMLLEAGEPAKTVQDRLGHAQVATTLDTYSHVSADLQNRAARAIEGLLKDASV